MQVQVQVKVQVMVQVQVLMKVEVDVPGGEVEVPPVLEGLGEHARCGRLLLRDEYLAHSC